MLNRNTRLLSFDCVDSCDIRGLSFAASVDWTVFLVPSVGIDCPGHLEPRNSNLHRRGTRLSPAAHCRFPKPNSGHQGSTCAYGDVHVFEFHMECDWKFLWGIFCPYRPCTCRTFRLITSKFWHLESDRETRHSSCADNECIYENSQERLPFSNLISNKNKKTKTAGLPLRFPIVMNFLIEIVFFLHFSFPIAFLCLIRHTILRSRGLIM